jgi:hypothetical protein
MGERLSPEQQKVMAFIISAMIVIGAAIAIAKSLFPYFLLGSIVLLIALIISAIIEIFFRDYDYLDFWDYISVYIGIAFLIVISGMFITYFIGYGVGGTSLGQACTEVYNAFTGAEEQMNQAINQVVEESCKTIPKESCETLRVTAKTAKTLQEVQNMADKLKTAKELADSISK